ncbi:hypothetical protein [Massilia soli]|uniref:TIGR04438 family Trp-rich protein n=1 Tax=Massilia soli TaxID=2792854 RepID=A0ABS7SN73_9BURK|nr:hypothetical protein [Massilia soli]MBZ2207137.1 hypothetical protein [Massilia soli]
MKTALKLLVKMIAVCFALVVAWAIMEDMPRWGLNLMVLALLIIALSLWVKCEAWSKRYLLKAGFEEWSNERSKIIAIFLQDRN